MDDNEYAAALKWHEESVGDPEQLSSIELGHFEAIRRALLLAERVTKEPSIRMLRAAKVAPERYEDEFKAMIQQCLKEINDGE